MTDNANAKDSANEKYITNAKDSANIKDIANANDTDTPAQERRDHTASLIVDYYRERDPEKRRILLDEIKTGGDPLFDLREKLFAIRYRATNNPSNPYADNYLFAFMQMLQARNESKGILGFGQRRMKKTLLLFGKEEADKYGEEGADMLHREIVNAALRYFDTCQSFNYRRKLFGTMTPTDEERAANIRKDAYSMSYALAARFGLKEESAFLCRAVSEAYHRFAPDAAPLERVP